MSRSYGNAMIEYAVIGAIMLGAAIALLGMVGGTFQGALSGLKQNMATHRDAAIRGEMAVLEARQSEQLGGLTAQFSAAEANLLRKSLAEKIQTAGANGSTRVLAKQLYLLADQLLQQGKVNQEQYDLLMQLSNQGYRIAHIESLLEDAIRHSGGDINVFSAYQVNLDRQPQAAYEMALLVGYLYNSPTTSEEFLEMPAEQKMAKFVALYRQALDSGALADPVARATVDSAVLQIAQVGSAVEDAIYASIKGLQAFTQGSIIL